MSLPLLRHHLTTGRPRQGVRRRHVFFVPGYDPNVARRYRELYRKEAAKQGDISGFSISVSASAAQAGSYGWQVDARMEGQNVTAGIEFLTWQDIVRTSMSRSVAATYLVLMRTFWIYLMSGALWRLFRLRRPPMIAALYPAVVLLLQLAIALGIGFGIAFVAAMLLPTALAALPGLAAIWGILTGFRRLDRHLFAYYLINDYAYTALGRGRWPQALDARIDAFAARILEAAGDPAHDEVLIVGHSSGAHIAAAALARALRQGLPKGAPPIGFLTLGQVIPMLSFLPEASELRRDLHDLSRSDKITWIDISAPGDGGCFALTDPVHVTGIAPPDGQKLWPKIISAAFKDTMSKESHQRTRWRFFRRHIQYLCAFEHPRDYDYFRVTAGPLTLAERFSHRGSTASRKETILSAYRDMA